jgi:hypothetical protein
MIFENIILCGIFEPERDEVTAGWSKRHIEELHYLYSSPNTVRAIELRVMKRARHVAHIQGMRNEFNILGRKTEGRDRSEVPGLDWRIILKFILKNRVGECGLDLCASG